MTEVYHIDGEAKEQGNRERDRDDVGVVFCEMLGREKTESDLLSFHFCQLMYPQSGYAYETGGLTKEIAILSNEEVLCEFSQAKWNAPKLGAYHFAL